MGVLKRIIRYLLSFVLFNLVVMYILSVNIESLVVNNIVKETLKEGLKNSNIEEILPIKDSNQLLSDLLEKESPQELLKEYSHSIINYLSHDNDSLKMNLEDDLITIINTNRNEVESKIGINQTNIVIGTLKEFKIHHVLSNSIEKTIELTKNNLTEQEKVVLKIYNLIKSTNFKNIIMILFTINVILLLLISESLYNLIRYISTSILFGGLAVIMILLIAEYVIKNKINIPLSLTNTDIFKMAILLTILGIIILIFNIIIRNIIKKIKNHK